MVEHSAVNRVVVGSSPTRGALSTIYAVKTVEKIRPHGQAVKTSPFHGGNTGSNPVGVTGIESLAKLLNSVERMQLYNSWICRRGWH